MAGAAASRVKEDENGGVGVDVDVSSASASVVVKKMGNSPSLELPPSLSSSSSPVPVSIAGMACCRVVVESRTWGTKEVNDGTRGRVSVVRARDKKKQRRIEVLARLSGCRPAWGWVRVFATG